MVETAKDRAHATLAPSAAYRWMECPGSIFLSQGIESTSSVFANEGTAAHELAGHCLSMGFDADRFLEYVIDIKAESPPTMFLANSAAADGEFRFLVTEEMVESVQMYLDHVRSRVRKVDGSKLEVEQRLDMTHIHEDIWGTGDACYYDARDQWLFVDDLKYGKGVSVDIEDNPQVMLYGAGAVRRHHNRPIKGITLSIVQPRAPHDDGPIRSEDINPVTLMEWEDDLAQMAARTNWAAENYEHVCGKYGLAEWEKRYLKAGDWCRFCPVLPTCSAARTKATAGALADFTQEEPVEAPERMSPERRAEVLTEAEFIGNWVKSVQKYAHDEATKGNGTPGWKLVAKRAIRRWKDDEDAQNALITTHGLDADDIFADPKFKSPAMIEKLTGKKGFKAIEDAFVIKKSSGTNLAPEADKRPAVKPDGVSEFEGVR